MSIKVVFTALAMVAFSGAAMANTREVKEDLTVSDCYEKAIRYIETVFDPNGTKNNEQVEAAYQGYLQGCYDGNKTASITAN